MSAHEVLVVARRDPWREQPDVWKEHGNVALTRIMRKITPKYRRLKINAFINGVQIPKQDWDATRAKPGDIVNLRVVPTFGGSNAMSAMGGLALGGGALALLSLFGSSNRKEDQNVTQSNTLAPPPENPPDPPLPPVDGYGGAKDTVMPAIMGVSNRKNNWGPVPNVYGNPVRIAPVVVADPFFLVEGNEQYMYVVLSCGIGPLDIYDIKIGTKTIEELTTAGVVQWEKREGKPGDINTPLTLYTRDTQTVSPGVSLTTTAQTQTGGQSANELAVDILFPNGLYSMDRLTQQTGPNGFSITYPDTGQWTSQSDHTVTFTVSYRLHGTSDPWISFSLSSGAQNRTDAFFIGTKWSVATEGLYEVKIVRSSSDAASNYSYNAGGYTFHHTKTPAVYAATWAQLKSIKTGAPIQTMRDANGDVIPLTLIALKIKASELLNGTIDNLTCMVRRYLRGWDGDAYTAAAVTNSPAWAFIDAIIGYINNSRLDGFTYVDLDTLLVWHNYCVSKGFTYNRVIDEFTTIMELLREIASHGRASVHAIDNKFTVVIDKEKTTVKQMFTPATAHDLEWELDWPEYPHGVKVKFRNPSADWNVDERTVYDDSYDANNATVFETLDFAGLTDSTAAYKHGRYALASVRLRPVKYFLECDAQALCCNRGDLVRLNYDVSFHGLGAGIIKSVTDNGTHITAITLDQKVVMEAGNNYGVQIRLSDGRTFLSAQVVTAAGETNTLTLTTPISLAADDQPAAKNSVAFGFLNREAADMLVEGIEYHDDLAATVTMIDYSPGIFDADTGTIPPYEPNVSIPHEAASTIAAPEYTTIETGESVILKQPGALLSRIQISLVPPTDSIAYIVAQYRVSGTTAWLPAGMTDVSGGVNAVYITGVNDRETYDVQLRYVGTFGLSSEWTVISSIYVVGKSTPPPDIPYLDIVNQGGEAYAAWKYDALNGVVVPIDFFCYELRANPGIDPNWDAAQVIASEYFSTQFNLSQLQSGQITLMIKAKDVAGNVSTNAAVLYKNISGSYIDNIVEQTDYHTAWDGVTISGGAITGNEIWADANTSTFWPALGSAQFWGTPLSLFWNATFTDMVVSFSHTPSYSTSKPFNLFLQWLSQNVQPLVEVQRGSQATFWAANPAATFWAASSSLFWPSDSPWQPVPQAGLDGAWETYDFRLRFAGGTNRAKLQQLSRILDMPDIEEIVQAIIVNSGALTLSQTYREIKSVQLTLAKDATYPDAKRAEAEFPYDVDGPVVHVEDASFNPTSGRVTALVKGY